jgi:CheY-like chemotaxis protein
MNYLEPRAHVNDHKLAADINGWEAALSVVLGCLMMLPILMDLYHPLQIPYGWLFLMPVCLYSVASASHERIWTVLAACSAMLVIETAIYFRLNETASSLTVLSFQTAALALLLGASFVTHYRLWARENNHLQSSLDALKQQLNRANEVQCIAENAYGLSSYQYFPGSTGLTLSDAMLELLGKPTATGLSLQDLASMLLTGYKEAFDNVLHQCMTDGTPFTFECQLLSARQERLWLEISGNPETSDSEVTGIIGTIRNLTSDKQQQLNYTTEIARMHDSLHAFPGILWQYGESEGVAVINYSSDGNGEEPRPEIFDATTLNLIHPDDRRHLLRQWLRAQRGNAGNFSCSTRILCRDQKYRHYQLQATRNRYEDSSLLRSEWVGIALQIKAEINAAATLSHADSDSIQELTHSLNNIFTTILGAAETIEFKPDNQELVAEETETIINGIEKACDLIRTAGNSAETELGEPEQQQHSVGETTQDVEPRAATVTYRDSGSLPAIPAMANSILLVEDDELVRKHAGNLLVRAGYQVYLACDGLEALEILQQQQQSIGIMITDMFMPGAILGSELIERTRSKYPHIHTILASGYDTSVVSFFNNPAGRTQDILAKPFRAKVLLETVAAAMANASAVRPEAAKPIHA